MCFKKKKKQLVIPHPEEKENPLQTLENTDIDGVIDTWMVNWAVPHENWDYWEHQVEVHLDPSLNFPAGAYEYQGKRHIVAKPSWFNPGVVAHEQAHNSYALLTDVGKQQFTWDFNRIKETDPLIRYLFTLNGYGLTDVVEGHAEVYRYIGQSMPEALKKYYPKLF
jgi:hypothetical protein